MTDWWTVPYPENPNPPKVSLPRVLEVGCPDGQDVIAMKRSVSRGGRWPWPAQGAAGFDDTFSASFSAGKAGGMVPDSGVKGVQRQSGLHDDGILGPNTFEAIRIALVPQGIPNAGQPLFDSVCLNLLKQASYAGVPDLGPVWNGGKSVLNQDLTHATGGLPGFPAFDDCFNAGVVIIAPEPGEVYQQSSANPGDAFYFQGDSKLRYWFGHLTSSPANGARFAKGAKLSTVLDHNVGGGPHVHVGIDAVPLIGHELQHHTNYSHGAPTVGQQLAEALL